MGSLFLAGFLALGIGYLRADVFRAAPYAPFGGVCADENGGKVERALRRALLKRAQSARSTPEDFQESCSCRLRRCS
jgi:hypothetical protein